MFKTNRLNIRELNMGDIENIHILHSLPETDQFNTLGIPDTIETTEKIVEKWLEDANEAVRKSFVLCIDLEEIKQFIGVIALVLGKQNYRSAEVWYKTHPSHWRKGYTTEALTRLLEFGFNDLGLHRIEAGCAIDNIASVKVLEKMGMKREGMKRKNLPVRGAWIDNYFYSILEEEFMNINPKIL